MLIRKLVCILSATTMLVTPTPSLAIERTGVASSALPPQRAPARPNVLMWVLDDVGFAQLSSFGGLIDTPNIDRVAQMGLRYSNYHTPPICSASRAALLTGRNPHSIHLGGHAAITRPYPGYDADIPPSAGTVADNLLQAGYRTFALGKWDHVPIAELSAAGPYSRWPLGQGFERFYGFLMAETDNWSPLLTQDNMAVAKPAVADYHLSADLADRAIEMISSGGGRDKEAPFFMYWATGVAHAPHHAPADWIARYRGRFDEGWDVARERILRQQIAAGLIPSGTKLAPRPEGMPAWASLTAEQRRLYARQMEAFAAALSHADAQFGRILDLLQARGELDNTMIIITSDNGASAEGAAAGAENEHSFVNGVTGSDAENMPFLNRWGGPETYPHYALGWAVTGNTPLRYYKQTTHEGGTRVPLIVAWPKGISARGQTRRQFAYATDLAPTILQAAGVPMAKSVRNTLQTPMEGESLVPTFTNSNQTSGRAQYVEMYGNKGLWSGNWSIVTTHRTKTWDATIATPVTEAWELYDLSVDPGQTTNLAAQYPDKVNAMSRQFEQQTARYHVNPIGNISEAYQVAGRASLQDFTRRQGIWGFKGPVRRVAAGSPPVLNLSYRMTADVLLSTGNETGPIFASGGYHGGAGLYLKAGRPTFIMRALDGTKVTCEASTGLPKGTTRLTLDFERPAATAMTSAPIRVRISADGRELVSGGSQFTLPMIPGEPFDVGYDDGSALTPDYDAGTPFPGDLSNIIFDFRAKKPLDSKEAWLNSEGSARVAECGAG